MKRIYIAGITFVILLIVVFVLIKNENSEVILTTTNIATQPFKIVKEKISKFTIKSYPQEDGQPSDKLQEITFVKGENGDIEGKGWNLSAPVGGEADNYAVKSFLDRFGELKVLDIASEQKKSFEDLKVDEKNGIEVEIYEGDNKVAHMIIGKSGGGFTMIKPEGEEKVYRVNGSLRYVVDKQLRQWRNRTIVKTDKTKITRIEFTNKNGQFVFEKDSTATPAQWKIVKAEPQIPEYESSKVDTIVNSLQSISAYDFLDPPYTANPGLEDADNPAKMIFVEKAEGGDLTHTVLIGNQQVSGSSGESGNYYSKIQGRDQIYVISKYLGDRFVPNIESFKKGANPPRPPSINNENPSLPNQLSEEQLKALLSKSKMPPMPMNR